MGCGGNPPYIKHIRIKMIPITYNDADMDDFYAELIDDWEWIKTHIIEPSSIEKQIKGGYENE